MVMSSDQFLHQLEMQNENWSERWKVKLGGKDMDIYRFLLLDGLFMTAFRSKDIRVWDLAAEETTAMALTVRLLFSVLQSSGSERVHRKRGLSLCSLFSTQGNHHRWNESRESGKLEKETG